MSGTAEATVLAALRAVVRDHGWLVAGSPARLRATLSDVLGPQADQHRGLVDAVVVSAEEGVPAEIRSSGRAGLAELSPTLTERLVDWGMAEDRATWVIDAWSSLLPESTLQPVTPVATPTPPAPAAGPTVPPPPAGATELPPAAAPYLAPTMLPPTPVATPGPGSSSQASGPAGWLRSRRFLLVAGITAVALVLGVVGVVALTRGDEKPEASTSGDGDDASTELPRASGTELSLSATNVDSIPPVVMGGYRDGVALVGLSTLESMTESDGTSYAPPEGGSIIGFRLADGSCELRFECQSWQDARLSLSIDGRSKPLPDPNSLDAPATYVAAVPEGAVSVDVVLQSDGRRQAISLLSGEPSASNLAVLARSKRFWKPNKKFSTTERVSIPIDYGDDIGRRSVTRLAKVAEYSLQYWADRKNTATGPDRALLRVNTYYNYPQDENPGDSVWYWRNDEVQFRDAQGRLYRPVRLPRHKEADWYDFEYFFDVPASITGGTLLLGGSIDLIAGGTDIPYTATTPVTPVQLRLS